MPSNKSNLIDTLRGKHDPHYKLAGRVEGLEKELPIQISQLHKTLSKSFAMQRKTLVRVLGLEKRVEELEAAKASVQEAVEQLEEGGEEIPEGLDSLLDDVRGEKKVGGTATKTKPKAKKKPKIKAKKKKITGKDLKKGTALETPEERAQRLEQNAKDSAAGEEHQKTDEYKDTTTATDEKGEYLSPEERKKRFKASKFLPPSGGVSSEDIKPDTQAEMGEDEGKKDRIVQFLNVDVKDKLDGIGASVKEIKGVLDSQNELAIERDEEMRQALLASQKEKREEALEGKKKGMKDKLLAPILKPAESFFAKIIRFVMVTFVGSVVNRIISIIKDPSQLLDPIVNFFNGFIGLMNAVMRKLWSVTGAPVNSIIDGLNSGIQFIIDSINKVIDLLPGVGKEAIKFGKIPTIPGPWQIQEIPLSKTAQERNQAAEVQGANEGGEVSDIPMPMQGESGIEGEAGADGETVVNATDISAKEGGEVNTNSGIKIEGMGTDTQLLAATPGEQVVTAEGVKNQQEETGTQPIDFNKGPNANQPKVGSTDQITAASTGGVVGSTDQITAASTGGVVGEKVQPRTPRVTRLSVGGVVPSPYPMQNVLGTGHNVIDTAPQNIMGYKRGGDVVKAKLTPGEIVMNEEQQREMLKKTGVDPSSFVPKPQAGKVKFASGGVVTPNIPTPNGKNGGVIVIGGNKKSGGAQVASNPQRGTEQSIKFSSTDSNNITIPTIKSIYNIIS